jgi:hypothetical protein
MPTAPKFRFRVFTATAAVELAVFHFPEAMALRRLLLLKLLQEQALGTHVS